MKTLKPLLIGAASFALIQLAAPSDALAAGVYAEVPMLWSVTVAGGDKANPKRLVVCADAAIRSAFQRSLPSPNGKTCEITHHTQLANGGFSAQCKSEGVDFNVHSQTSGDVNRKFSVVTTISADTTPRREFGQTLSFARIGACPAGWSTGDSAERGSKDVINAISGEARLR